MAVEHVVTLMEGCFCLGSHSLYKVDCCTLKLYSTPTTELLVSVYQTKRRHIQEDSSDR
jgi:hypothetical protein